MDPVELINQLERRVLTNIADMGEALSDGACLNSTNTERAYANCVGRVEAWKSVLNDIHEIRQKYVDE